MRMTRSGAAVLAGIITASTLVSRPAAAQGAPAEAPAPAPVADDDNWYPMTLYFGTGLIDNPVAWVAPSSGELYLTVTGKNIPATEGAGFSTNWNTNGAIETHWMNRFTLGFSLYSQNPDWGFFGHALVLKENAKKHIPAIAVGLRNLGPRTHEDRFMLGGDVKLDSLGQYVQDTPGYAKDFHTASTFYCVATSHWRAGSTSIGASLGYGSGLFYDDGKLGKNYNDKGTIVRGLFLGANANFHPSENTIITLMAENNGWDWNAGVVGNWRGVYLGLYGTELEEGGKSPSKGTLYTIYNYTKFNVAIGYSGNLHAISHGTFLRTEVTDLEREQARLQREIALHEENIAQLENSLRKAQAGELAEVAKRREALESQINEEREAIKRAEDRLRQLQEGGAKPPPTTPTTPEGARPPAPTPSSTPPASTTTPPRSFGEDRL